MKVKEIREMNENELLKLMEEQKSKAAQLRFDIAAKQLKGHRALRQSKKTVAQVLTILREKAQVK